jgi:mediator of RNA polymerase II transcription subunit 12
VGNPQLPQLAHATAARRGASASSAHDAGRLRPQADATAGSQVKGEDAGNLFQLAVTSHPANLDSGSVATPASGFSDSTSHDVPEKQQSRIASLHQVAPFPPRPVQSALWRRSQLSAALTIGNTNAASTADPRAQNMEVPSLARVFPDGQLAGFLPWRGTHPEDNLTELTIKSGFQNKPIVPLNNESNTARVSLWPHLKKQGGAQHLSQLFISLLERRQAVGRVTEPSTFKLPHRLAMTNTRRESYLRELADPNWPMRKLTRSIPHTVSGRVLLDQCLAKRIPVARAVWLAKCVGAHDLRAIKKKSASGSTTMGGEAKWIKEWTVHVEHFLRSVLTGDKDSDLEEKMAYSLQLSSCLFNERLLDEDHFVDWILSMFESSKTDDVFIWLLLVQMHWPDLVRNRRRGRRLAEAILSYLDLHFSNLDADDVLQPIYKILQKLLIRLVLKHRSCLVLPNSWHRFQPTIQRLQQSHPTKSIQFAIRSITRRNNKLVAQPSGPSQPTQPQQSLFHLLDSNSFHSSPNEVVAKCLEHDTSIPALIGIIMQWASSVYRSGHHRIYMAARLIRRLQKSYDTEASIWAAVTKLADNPGCHELLVYQVVVELARSGHFSVGRLLQYIIATGVASSPDGPKDPLLRLLSHLPEHNMPDEISNLRSIVLETAGISVCATPPEYMHVQQAISKEMDGVEQRAVEISTKATSLTLGQRFSLAFWIRDFVMSNMDADISSSPWMQSQSSRLERLFLLTRSILEDIQEYPCLADVVGSFITGDNQGHLTSVVHTLHYNHRCFIAIGAMKPLFDKLVGTYEALRARQSLTKNLCSAILDLCATLDASKSFVAQVTQDLQRCDQLSALAMCSPASDNVMELSAAEIDSEMEIDKILSSGTTMDEQMQARVFKRIASKIEESYATGLQRMALGGLLSRLRSFDTSNFDFQLRTWVSSLMSSPDKAAMLYSYVVPIIVGSSCVTLAEFDRFTNEKGGSDSLQLALHRLTAVIPDFDVDDRCPAVVSGATGSDITNVTQEMYKYRLDRTMYSQSCHLAILRRLNDVLNRANIQGEQDESFSTFFKSRQLAAFLSDVVSCSSENAELQDMLCEGINWNGMAQPLFQSLMDPTGRISITHDLKQLTLANAGRHIF